MNKVLLWCDSFKNYFGLTVLISVVFGGDGECYQSLEGALARICSKLSVKTVYCYYLVNNHPNSE